jgi:hypothetical protein
MGNNDMTFETSEQFEAVIAAIDAANAEDTRETLVDGKAYPFETVYAERMTETMENLYPDAS